MTKENKESRVIHGTTNVPFDYNLYFKTNKFFKFLRFLGLLEPGVNVLSQSKAMLWVMMFVLIYVIFYIPDNIAVVIGAVATAFGTIGNYAYRRHIQYLQTSGYSKPENVKDTI